jgi:hypothetical protein
MVTSVGICVGLYILNSSVVDSPLSFGSHQIVTIHLSLYKVIDSWFF